MKIERSKPFARGVADLMYVGDVPAAAPIDTGSVVTAGLLGFFALRSKGATRIGLAGAAAYFVLKATGKLGVFSA